MLTTEVQTSEAQREEESPFSRFLQLQDEAMVAKRAIGHAASQAASEGRYEEAHELTLVCISITRTVNELRNLV